MKDKSKGDIVEFVKALKNCSNVVFFEEISTLKFIILLSKKQSRKKKYCIRVILTILILIILKYNPLLAL